MDARELASGKVTVQVQGDLTSILFHRAERRNAIDLEVLGALDAALADAEQAQARAIVISGIGGNFSAGADLSDAANVHSGTEADEFIGRFQRVFGRIRRIGAPVIAAIEGYALGAGFELSLWCDIRVVSRGSLLGIPETRIGAIAAGGGVTLLPRVVGESVALDLILTGEPITGERAFELGLATRLTSPGAALETATELALRLVQSAPLALAAGKRIVAEGMYLGTDALASSRSIGASLFATADRREGVGAFLEKRTPTFRGR